MNSNKLIKNIYYPGKSDANYLFYFIIAWIPYALLTYHFWWVCDDAFISFRYALNAASGHGLRFNIGSHIPVEGYSNFLWVIIAALFEFFKLDITFWPNVLSFLCGSTLLYLVFCNLCFRFEIHIAISFLATLLLGLNPSFAIWSTSGLETVPFALLLFITFERLILRKESIAPVAAGIAGLALALIRTEGIYWAIVMVGISMISRKLASERFKRAISVYLAIILIGYSIYWVSRYSYYQLPFANTAYAKVSISMDTLIRGFNYVTVQYLTLLPFFIILPGILIVLLKNNYAIGLSIAIMPVAITVYAILVSGDFMPMARLLVPAIPFNSFLFAWLLDCIWQKTASRKYISLLFGIILICIGLAPSWNLHVIPESVRALFHFRLSKPAYSYSEYDQWRFAQDNARLWAMAGITLKAHSHPDDSLIRGAIGAVGYYSGLFIYDKLGLVTRSVILHSTKNRPLRTPGHDNYMSATFFIEKKPTFYHVECVEKKQLTRKAVRECLDLLTPEILKNFDPGTKKFTKKKNDDKFNHSKLAKFLLLIKPSNNGLVSPEFIPLLKDSVSF